MDDKDLYIGYLKYSGKLVDDGYLDARKSAQALLGLDASIRHLIVSECPKLNAVPFEIPVRVRKGSWEVLIPKTIEQWILAAMAISGTAYLTSAATKIAENDFKDVSLQKLFKKALNALQWIVKIGVHLGDMTNKKFKEVKFKNNNQEIGIPNSKKEYLYIPREFLNLFIECPPKLLSDMTKLVEKDRELRIGVIENDECKEVKITYKEKYIFTSEEDSLTDTLFPELIDGQEVELEGEITKGNELTNSMGLQYKGHILTCIPVTGSIINYKQTLFLKCKIKGTINRKDKLGQPTEKKPKLVFTIINPVDNDNGQRTLF